MRVRLRTTMAGPAGTFQAGQVVDLSTGAALVAAGYADAVDAPAPVAARPIEEARTVQAETAVTRGRKAARR